MFFVLESYLLLYCPSCRFKIIRFIGKKRKYLLQNYMNIFQFFFRSHFLQHSFFYLTLYSNNVISILDKYFGFFMNALYILIMAPVKEKCIFFLDNSEKIEIANFVERLTFLSDKLSFSVYFFPVSA